MKGRLSLDVLRPAKRYGLFKVTGGVRGSGGGVRKRWRERGGGGRMERERGGGRMEREREGGGRGE